MAHFHGEESQRGGGGQSTASGSDAWGVLPGGSVNTCVNITYLVHFSHYSQTRARITPSLSHQHISNKKCCDLSYSCTPPLPPLEILQKLPGHFFFCDGPSGHENIFVGGGPFSKFSANMHGFRKTKFAGILCVNEQSTNCLSEMT